MWTFFVNELRAPRGVNFTSVAPGVSCSLTLRHLKAPMPVDWASLASKPVKGTLTCTRTRARCHSEMYTLRSGVAVTRVLTSLHVSWHRYTCLDTVASQLFKLVISRGLWEATRSGTGWPTYITPVTRPFSRDACWKSGTGRSAQVILVACPFLQDACWKSGTGWSAWIEASTLWAWTTSLLIWNSRQM